MKKLSLLVLLALFTCSLHAELLDRLNELSQSLGNLTLALTPKPAPVPAAIETWDDLVKENNKRKNESSKKASELTTFKGLITMYPIAYVDLVALQEEYKDANPWLVFEERGETDCGKFQAQKDLHLTLLYINIPIETAHIPLIPNRNKPDLAGYRVPLKDYLVKAITALAPVLKTISFEYAERNKILGAKPEKKFLSALYTPKDGINSLREKFIIPFAEKLFAQFPYAWIDFLESDDFHFSLATLQGNCVNRKINEPAPLPAMGIFNLANSTANISVSVYGAKGIVEGTW